MRSRAERLTALLTRLALPLASFAPSRATLLGVQRPSTEQAPHHGGVKVAVNNPEQPRHEEGHRSLVELKHLWPEGVTRDSIRTC